MAATVSGVPQQSTGTVKRTSGTLASGYVSDVEVDTLCTINSRVGVSTAPAADSL
jgi:hypothetical protein